MHPKETRVLLPEDLKHLNSIADYKAQGGLEGLKKARTMSSEELIKMITDSGLRGRGGAGFPTGIKWNTVYNEDAENKFVVCNFAEGEPGTYKDRYLIDIDPYKVFEGILITGHAIGAKKCYIGTKKKFTRIVERITKVLKEYEDEGMLEPGYLEIVLGPDEYLFGEEKALLEVVDGRYPMPRMYPPFLVGVGYTPSEPNPTVVNNAESMCHVAMILKNGVEWFRSYGSEDTPGTSIISLTGDVKKPGMYEISLGLPVRDLLYDLGGGPLDGREFKAVFSGVANRVMTPDQFDLPLEFGTLRQNGVGLGSGGFMVYDDSRWIVDMAWMFSHFLAKSSCGQCVPCNSGTRIITEHLVNIREGRGSQEDIDAIKAESGKCTSQTRCFLPTQESILVPSCIDKFPAEFEPGHNINQYDRDILVPKIQDFDDATQTFTFEAKPKEFLPTA